MRAFGAALLAVAVLGSGCASLNAAQTANTMGQGGMQVGIEPGYSHWGSGNDTFTFPRLDFALRYGLSDRVDIGGRIGSTLAEINAKFQLTDPANDGFVASIAPSIGGIELSGSSSNGDNSTVGLINIAVPVLLGLKVGEQSQLVIGPRIQDFLINGSSNSGGGLANILGAGASVGFAAAVTDGFRIMPEVGFVFPLNASATTSSGSGSASIAGSSVLWQVGLSFLVGQYHQHHNTAPPGPGAYTPANQAPSSAPPPPPNYPPPPPSYPPGQ